MKPLKYIKKLLRCSYCEAKLQNLWKCNKCNYAINKTKLCQILSNEIDIFTKGLKIPYIKLNKLEDIYKIIDLEIIDIFTERECKNKYIIINFLHGLKNNSRSRNFESKLSFKSAAKKAKGTTKSFSSKTFGSDGSSLKEDKSSFKSPLSRLNPKSQNQLDFKNYTAKSENGYSYNYLYTGNVIFIFSYSINISDINSKIFTTIITCSIINMLFSRNFDSNDNEIYIMDADIKEYINKIRIYLINGLSSHINF